jgi:hypothetical protein
MQPTSIMRRGERPSVGIEMQVACLLAGGQEMNNAELDGSR